MNKQKELAKNTIIITIGKICTQFMSFFLMPLYTLVLSTSEYGVVDLLATYTSLLTPIALFQIDQALFRFLIDTRKNKEKTEKIISTSVVFMIIQSGIVLALFYIIQLFFDFQYKWYLLFCIFASVISNMMLQASRGLGDNTTYAVGSFISAFLQIIGNVVFLTVFNYGVEGMLMATILSQLLAALFVFVKKRIFKYIQVNFFDVDCLREILKYSLPLIPNALCWWALNASDRTIVLVFLGTASNGLLSVGHKFSSIYITIYNIFNLSWTESASIHMNDDDRDAFFTKVITNMFKLFMCAGLGLVAIMPFVFKILINEQYGKAYDLIPIFILASMFNIVVGLYSVVYVALRKTGEIAKTSLYAGIINVLTHLIMVKFIGLFAAPVSSVIAFVVMAIYRCIDIKKYINVKLKISVMILFVFLFILTTIIYLSKNTIVQAVWVVFTIVISIILNFSMVKSVIEVIGKKFKR